jgi:hypothetical protein
MLEKRADDRQARLERTEKSWRFCVFDSAQASSNPCFPAAPSSPLVHFCRCDPLLVPCLEESYWAAFDQKSVRDLARTLAWVHGNQKAALPAFSNLSQEAKLALEEKNIVQSLSSLRRCWILPRRRS